jgi:hypothetical protein
MPDWTGRAARRMYEGAGLGPKDVDIFNPYDGYAPMAQFFLEAFQWHGVKRGDAFAFYVDDIRVEGPHPFCSSGGNLGNGRTRTAMYTDSIEQLRGTAGARQVRVRGETALAAFTTSSGGGWIMFGKDPSWGPVTLEITNSRDHSHARTARFVWNQRLVSGPKVCCCRRKAAVSRLTKLAVGRAPNLNKLSTQLSGRCTR